MKLVTFTPAVTSSPSQHDSQPDDQRFGVLQGDFDSGHIVDLSTAGSGRVPPTLHAFLRAGLPLSVLQEVAASATPEQRFTRDQVRLLPPIARPEKIICVGQNYLRHIIEMGREAPTYPVIFAKFPNVLIGDGAVIPMPTVSTMLDYEGELAFVIGKRAKNVVESDAYQYIAGYSVFNDVTVRDFQRRTSQFLQGKTFDGSGPMGPALVTADEIPDPMALDLTTRLNGEMVQHSNTNDMHFQIPFLVAFLSQIVTLEAGDIIATGTPEGVGFARDPQVFMKPGDVIEVTISGLGTLRNTVG